MSTRTPNRVVEISDTATERLRCPKFFLVGKVLSRKAIRANLVMAVFKDLWSSKANVEAMVIGDNRILLCFNLEAEVQCVLRGSPWYFSKTLLVLAEVKGFDVHVEVPIREQEFWV
ncbi:hypothetical protein ACFXTH_031839 [Malus domestica]